MGIGPLDPWPQWFRRLWNRLYPPPKRTPDKAEQLNNGDDAESKKT